MSVVAITGSCGLVGYEASRFFCKLGFKVIGIDNNMREVFFGQESSVLLNRQSLQEEFSNYCHYDIDIRDCGAVEKTFGEYGKDMDLVLHLAGQPSHDWPVKSPGIDFSVNVNGSFNLLETYRKYCPKAVFIFTSTNKVYGDKPNELPFIELEKRYELPESHRYYRGVDELFGIDNCLHSLFGASKAAADILVQEYGRYFNLKTAVFRGGCFAGPAQTGAEPHGFLSYLVKCCVTGKKYTIYGYKGKQVRDNIHSYDLVNAFYQFYLKPACGAVYNIGGGRLSNISVLEAIELCEKVSGKNLNVEYSNQHRKGDHIWWISDCSKFKNSYPEWQISYGIEKIVDEIYREQLRKNKL